MVLRLGHFAWYRMLVASCIVFASGVGSAGGGFLLRLFQIGQFLAHGADNLFQESHVVLYCVKPKNE